LNRILKWRIVDLVIIISPAHFSSKEVTMKGFFNRILRIHLKTKTFQEEAVPDSIFETTLGGKGLGTHLLMRENPPAVDPLAPENKLIFCTGPITDTRIYGSCRHGVFTKFGSRGLPFEVNFLQSGTGRDDSYESNGGKGEALSRI
jgi:hypothetical protein